MTYSGPVFFATMFDMMKMVLPAAFFLFIWRAFITNKTQPVMVLGEATASAYQQQSPSCLMRWIYGALASLLSASESWSSKSN